VNPQQRKLHSVISPPQINYIDNNARGFERHLTGKDFTYFSPTGKRLKNAKSLKRINALVIPPNWKDVWICADPNGHLQATGYDEKGRKQYIYHEDWTRYRQQQKFSRLSTFGRALPAIRHQVKKDLSQQKWPKSRVLALVVTLMDNHYLRVGNNYYKDHNQTFGLTTLRRKHLEEEGDQLKLSYKAKSGKYRNITLKNRSLIKLILATSELPGYEIFRYLDNSGKSQKIDSQDVNEYLRRISATDLSAKDFRTWGGTVMAIDNYEQALKEVKQNSRTKLETTIVRRVAKKLGNTISTCREYYLHPGVLAVLVQSELETYKNLDPDIGALLHLTENEKTALAIIEKAPTTQPCV
jgi:DNA topoisomerase-1